MRWFRDNIRQGSWAALIAVAINLALSFGHVHAIDGKSLGARASALVAAIASQDTDHKPGHRDDGGVDYLCPICVASVALATALAASPPVMAIDFAFSIIDRTIEPVLAVVEPQRAAFQSRGPPLS
jgi:hypothetical protein